MATDLAALVAPAKTAVLTMEMQRGIIGDLARLGALRDEVEAANAVPNAARLLDAARAAGVTVMHCTAAFRPDRRGSNHNAPMFEFAAREPDHLVIGTPDQVGRVAHPGALDLPQELQARGLPPSGLVSLGWGGAGVCSQGVHRSGVLWELKRRTAGVPEQHTRRLVSVRASGPR